MSMIGIRVRFEPLRSIAFGAISGTYAGVGTAVNDPIREMILKNVTDSDLYVSTDGVTDMHHMSSGQVDHFDFTSNKSIGGGFFLAQGDRIYVRTVSGAPTQGAVYLTTMYASDSSL